MAGISKVFDIFLSIGGATEVSGIGAIILA
jgi:hypothetical protein